MDETHLSNWHLSMNNSPDMEFLFVVFHKEYTEE